MTAPSTRTQTSSIYVECALETVARNLYAARIGVGMSQEQLAEAAKVSRATIIQLESGTGDPRLSTLATIADALGIFPALLLIGRDEIDAIANAPNSVEAILISEHLPTKELEGMRRLLQSGIPKNRNKAIIMGTSAATSAGLTAGAIAGAAIGSALIPGIGTVIGAVLGSLLSQHETSKDCGK
ncbi:helix-turn-helix transcriptional regulator [Crenobacter sp. SG2305]|uniref:helix-turn-helix domain-containing protein n=1 Tax=Crenobacter oryzisoli TaxID=3056844 RepID=UPI0025AB0E0F|nr:helix-turn-helix transcriptional regulator [Crenobacter sp. SG2305]MDN0082059.1 helix-turn-helix transcriptional regulator [Crenobacter sp. SG2305]